MYSSQRAPSFEKTLRQVIFAGWTRRVLVDNYDVTESWFLLARSFERRSLDVSLTSTPRGLKYTCHNVNKHIIGVMSSSTSSDEEYFFCRGIFLPGNFSAGEFLFRGIFRVLTRIELKFIGFKYEAWISCCCSVKLRHTPLARSHSLACANTCGGWVSWINYFFIASSLNQSVT